MSRGYYFRLLRFGLVALAGSLIASGIVLAWLYSYSLTHPPCRLYVSISNHGIPKKIILHTQDNTEIEVLHYPSINGATILSLGGINGSLGQNLPDIAFLLDEGYGIIQINSRSCSNPKKPVTLGYHEVYDAAAALTYLYQLNESPGKIGIFGFSMGGVTSIRTAAQYPEIQAVVAEGGFYNLGDDITNQPVEHFNPETLFLYNVAFFFRLQTHIDPWEINPIGDLKKISPRPVLLIFGENEITSAQAFEQFAATKEPKSLWIVPNGSHGNNHLIAPIEYRKRIIHFFNTSLLD